jgi:glucose dehydrogenase
MTPTSFRTSLAPVARLVLGLLILFGYMPHAETEESPLQKLSPVTDAMLAKPAADDWLMRRGNFASWGFSTLDQINTGNVGGLRLAWAWNMEPGYQEEAPLAHDGMLFLANPHSVVQALDGRTGDLLWEYRRELTKVEGGYHNDLFSRARGTIALRDDKVFLTTADAHIVALDAQTGKVIWDTAIADYRQGYTFTGGPLAAHGKAIAGISGCTNPGTSGCFIVALDAKTGTEVWRTKTIAQPGSPGDASWHGLPAEKRNGASVWTSGSYDPALNLFYSGTGGPTPHAGLVRGTGEGAVLYTDSTLALNADTGKIVWFYQYLPGDQWNLDAVVAGAPTLLDEFAAGHRRRHRVRRRRQPPPRRLRGHKRRDSLAAAAQQPAWRLSDDLHGRRHTICRRSGGPEPDRQPRQPSADAGDSCPQPRLDSFGVCAAGWAASLGRLAVEHQVTTGSHPSYRHEEPTSPNTCITLSTGGLLVRIQPEEPIFSRTYGHCDSAQSC